jgi:hypothetical protein
MVMDQTWRGALMMMLLVMLLVMVVGAMLAAAPGLALAQSQTGSERVEGAKRGGEGTAETAGAKTPGTSGQATQDVGDRLHDSAKNFGEALLGGIKHAGRTVIDFFNDDKSGKQGDRRP